MEKVMLISPARTNGSTIEKLLYKSWGKETKGRRLKRKIEKDGVTIEELFSYVTGANYFDNKLKYAQKWAKKFWIIVPDGISSHKRKIGEKELERWHQKDVKKDKEVIEVIRKSIGSSLRNYEKAVFLGSKEDYKDHLELIKDRVFYPKKLGGKSNWEKGAILKDALQKGKELDYGLLFKQ